MQSGTGNPPKPSEYWLEVFDSHDISSKDIFAHNASTATTFPEAADEIEKNAQNLPWCDQKKRKRKLLDSHTELVHQGHLQTFWLAEEDEHDTGDVINSPKKWAIRRKSSSNRFRVAKDKENLQLVISRFEPPVLGPRNCTAMSIRKDTPGRWSAIRYDTAQAKLFQILRARGARPGKPVPRTVLREEARKYIGDTGLLDHLLKHMVDKVLGDGQRFRRRHNSEGSMEYWLEDANLMDIRKVAGIEDPFWLPPPGWKPGEKLPERGYTCRGMTSAETAEMERLKQEVELLKSELRIAKAPIPDVECLAENLHLLPKAKESLRDQLENLKTNIEELQRAYMHLHELHMESAIVYQTTPDAGHDGKSTSDGGIQVESTLRKSDVIERLEKLEVQVRNITKEFRNTVAADRLNTETRFTKLWKVVSTLQENMLMTPQRSHDMREGGSIIRSMEQEIRTLDEEIGWLGLAPPA